MFLKVCLGDIGFGAPMDVWAIGCVAFEMAAQVPMFQADNPRDMLCRIFGTMGPASGSALEYFAFLPLWAPAPYGYQVPIEKLEARFTRCMSAARAQWLQSLFTLDPRSRPTAEHAFRGFE